MLAIIALIVIVAINPTNQLSSTNDRKRDLEKRELENAVTQYIIDGLSIATPPTGVGNARDICRDSVSAASCTANGTGYDLSFLTPEYLVSLPVDPSETDERVTGYAIYRSGSFNKICSRQDGSTCGP